MPHITVTVFSPNPSLRARASVHWPVLPQIESFPSPHWQPWPLGADFANGARLLFSLRGGLVGTSRSRYTAQKSKILLVSVNRKLNVVLLVLKLRFQNPAGDQRNVRCANFVQLQLYVPSTGSPMMANFTTTVVSQGQQDM